MMRAHAGRPSATSYKRKIAICTESDVDPAVTNYGRTAAKNSTALGFVTLVNKACLKALLPPPHQSEAAYHA